MLYRWYRPFNPSVTLCSLEDLDRKAAGLGFFGAANRNTRVSVLENRIENGSFGESNRCVWLLPLQDVGGAAVKRPDLYVAGPKGRGSALR